MRILVERLGARPTGFILLGVAAVLLVAAALIGWNAVVRWQAVAALANAGVERLGGDDMSARAAARDAAEYLPTVAATALPAIDPGDDAAQARLEALRAHVPPRERLGVEAVLALHQALRGKDAETEIAGSDGTLRKAIQQTAKPDAAAVKLTYDADAPPHLAFLRAALERQFRAAWLAGDVEAIRASAGPLLLLAPATPEGFRQRLILTALAPATADLQVFRTVTSAIANLDERLLLVRQLLRLAPPKARDLLIATIPSDRLLPEEQEFALVSGGGTLEQQVAKVLASPSPSAVRAVLDRAIQAGKPDLARQLIAKLPADDQKPVLVQLALAGGDLEALTTLVGDQAEYQLRISPVVAADGHAAFHLATSSGLVPGAGVQIRLAGKVVDAARIQRLASLVLVDTGKSAATLEVRLGQRVVATAEVAP